jgi:hypothetical protein
MTVIAMILHFNYHVAEIFYGIDVVRPDAKGEVPIGLAIIRNLFYHLPMVWVLILIYFQQKWVKLFFFILSFLYLLAHISHLVGELKFADPSQTSLLSLMVIIASILCFEHYRYWKNHDLSEDKIALN